ncbi:MAG: D-tyrosyl-tRNA(Tyr) deacylase [Magnetococcales bacterium]|nr:D-tyrosyl-tRNA(Tyr) deacylase [Magnetococcales bacterium]
MRALVQRVSQATVMVAGQTVGRIDRGLLVFLAIMRGDGGEQLEKMTAKVAGLRIFPDAAGKMNLSLQDVGGAVLVVSQFTLAADMEKGHRPSFGRAAEPRMAREFVERFCDKLRQRSLAVATGQFGADMQVHLVNDGPVTLWLDVPGAMDENR